MLFSAKVTRFVTSQLKNVAIYNKTNCLLTVKVTHRMTGMSCHTTLLDCFVTSNQTSNCVTCNQKCNSCVSKGTKKGTQVTSKVQFITSWFSRLNQSFSRRLTQVVDLPKFEIVVVNSITKGDDKNDKNKVIK